MSKLEDLNLALTNYLQQLNLSKEVNEAFLVFRKRYNSLFQENSAYEKILENAHLLKIKEKEGKEEETKNVKLLPLKTDAEGYTNIYVASKNCPYLFTNLDLPYDNNFGLARITKERPIESYCLSANQKGELFITIFFQNADAKLFNAKNSGTVFSLNLFLILVKMLNETNGKKVNNAVLKVEQIVKNNPASTLANVFCFIKAHPQETSNFYDSLVDYEIALEKAYKYFEPLRYDEGPASIPDNFTIPNSYASFPYLLKEDKKGFFLEMDCDSCHMSSYSFESIGEVFPYQIVFEKNEVKALYLSNSAYNRRATRKRAKKPHKASLPKTATILLNGAAKLEELMQLQKTADLNDFKAFCKHHPWQNAIFQDMIPFNVSNTLWIKNISEKDLEKFKKTAETQLKDNLEKVLATVSKVASTLATQKILENQKRELEKIKTLVPPLQQRANEITKLLAQVYCHEILLETI